MPAACKKMLVLHAVSSHCVASCGEGCDTIEEMLMSLLRATSVVIQRGYVVRHDADTESDANMTMTH